MALFKVDLRADILQLAQHLARHVLRNLVGRLTTATIRNSWLQHDNRIHKVTDCARIIGNVRIRMQAEHFGVFIIGQLRDVLLGIG